jgi:hypothetical protein
MQVVLQRMPRMLERPSASPGNMLSFPKRTIVPVINESGHESAVTPHRAMRISEELLASRERFDACSSPVSLFTAEKSCVVTGQSLGGGSSLGKRLSGFCSGFYRPRAKAAALSVPMWRIFGLM